MSMSLKEFEASCDRKIERAEQEIRAFYRSQRQVHLILVALIWIVGVLIGRVLIL